MVSLRQRFDRIRCFRFDARPFWIDLKLEVSAKFAFPLVRCLRWPQSAFSAASDASPSAAGCATRISDLRPLQASCSCSQTCCPSAWPMEVYSRRRIPREPPGTACLCLYLEQTPAGRDPTDESFGRKRPNALAPLALRRQSSAPNDRQT